MGDENKTTIEANYEIALIQEKIDNKYISYTKHKFELNYNYYLTLEPILDERDALLKTLTFEQRCLFWEKAISNFPAFLEMMSMGKKNIICGLKVSYAKDFNHNVEVELIDNIFIRNPHIKKTYNSLSGRSSSDTLDRKTEILPEFFKFFTVEFDSLEYFDILFELYVNAGFLYNLD